MVVSTPATWNMSLRLIGRPWSGPIGRPFSSKYRSSCAARSRALSKKISCKQLPICCAIAADLQNASVTSKLLRDRLASCSHSSRLLVLTILFSDSERKDSMNGPVNCLSFEALFLSSWKICQRSGILAAVLATFAAARPCHVDWDMAATMFDIGRKLVRWLTGPGKRARD